MAAPLDPAECKRLHQSGFSHRRLMHHYGCSLRQIQKALNPEKRQMLDALANSFPGRENRRLRRTLRLGAA